MRGLGSEIELALKTIIEGLNYDFFDPNNSADGDIRLDPEKMKRVMDSKISSFKSAKGILDKWVNSPNAPNKKKTKGYITQIVESGEKALGILREGLKEEINYKALDAHKHDAAVKAKLPILEAIFELGNSITELERKLESDDFTLQEKEFKLGYPERFAKGEFFPLDSYFKDWYNKEEDAVKICPHSTEGEIITIENLNIQLPKKPIKSKILFSDLPKKEQYWRRPEVPKGINPENVDNWNDFIVEELRRRREGIWFMNNGEAVYLTGNQYFCMTYCKMLDTGGFMDFRHAQLKMFYHLQACEVDKRCLGQLFVKSRRTGFTYVVLSVLCNASTSVANKLVGMTSMSNNDAQLAFFKYRYMLLNLPFFFRPVIKGKLDSPSEFEFAAPTDNSKSAKKAKTLSVDDYLNTRVNFKPTKNSSYDGQALYRYLGDESGKWLPPHDYVRHLGQISPTMLQGGRVVGKAFIGSTVGAMSEGGSQFKEMYEAADIKKRNEVTGRTTNGLYRYFLPAQDNMEMFTDKYGVCHTKKPKEPTYNVYGDLIEVGSIEYLMSEEKQKREENDKALNEQYRAFPRTVEYAFRDEASNSPFNVTKLNDQIDYNDSIPKESRYVVGNFRWQKGIKDSAVEFHPDPDGRFKVAWRPSAASGTLHLMNNVVKRGEKFFPLNDQLVRFGCDPYSYKSTHGKGSKGGIHGKTVYLPSNSNVPKNKFILEYIARPSDETIFFEDVIKMCFFYGSPILVESNRKDLLRHMYNRGYRGFCMDRLDRPKNKLNEDEKKYGGQMMSGQDIIDSHMSAIGTYIENHVGVYSNKEIQLREVGEMGDMPFNETLKDWLAFDPDKRTEYDATISSGLAIMACQEERYKGKTKKKTTINVGGLMPKYRFGKKIS